MKPPAIQLILDYKTFFEVAPPEDRLSLVHDICKKNLLVEIAGLNYRLKPNDTIYVDESIESQRRELDWFTHDSVLYNYYATIATKYTRTKDDYPNIFNRPTCLFALEEISNSNIPVKENFKFTKPQQWESILKYLLAVNYEITQIEREADGVKPSIEKVNPKLIVLNELRVKTDPLFTIYRGYRLISYLANNSKYAKHLEIYFSQTYDMDYEFFITSILHIYNAKVNDIPHLNFFFKLGYCQNSKFFNELSKRHFEKNTLLLLGIRKSPFIKVGSRQYILSDNALLLEKTYYQFINDFWFDCIKQLKSQAGKNLISHKEYFADIGLFFEDYLRELFTNSFKNYSGSVLLTFDQLKLIGSQKQEFELCDIYLRANGKIILGQAKATGIYDNEKYGGNIEKLYKNDREGFFKNFGVNQLVNSLKNLDANINRLDESFPNTIQCEIYPCIIVNDKALQTPLMNHIFNLRFQEVLNGYTNKKFKIYPLTLIHIMDIENIEESLTIDPKLIWLLLHNGFSNDFLFMPFYISIHRLLPYISYPKRLSTIFSNLFDKHNSHFKFSFLRIIRITLNFFKEFSQ